VISLVIAAGVVSPVCRSLVELGLTQKNYRGTPVAFPAGIAIFVAAFLALVPLSLLQELAGWNLFRPGIETALIYVTGVGLLGLLGDTGSNAIGAVAGLWLVLTLSTTAQAIALGVVLLITVYGEFRSISALIDRTPGLRHLDSLGRISHA